jgi:hypothetical protein
MKFRSKTIVVLEMDENELEVVMEAIDVVATGHKVRMGLMDNAKRFQVNYQEAIADFHDSQSAPIIK